MRSTRAIVAACVAAVLATSTVMVAGALITTSTSSVIRLTTPPASVKLNALQHATKVHAFDERQGVTLGAAVAVDAVNPGQYTNFPSGSATIAAGTLVDSHLIHSDPTTSFTARRQGSVTFSSNILGIVASTAKLAASDSLGVPTTLYAGTTNFRGLETSEGGQTNVGDKFTISSDRRTVTFDVKTYVMDEIRVITTGTNPLVTSISDSPDPVQAGGNITYVITVTNTGAAAAAGVQVTDTFPGATLVSANASGGCTGTTTVTCTLGSIPAGGSAAATIVVTSPSTGGTITNTATSPPGQNPAANTTTTVVSASLTTEIADDPDPVTAGNDVQYTLTVTNNGIASVANAHVVDTLPPGTTLVSAPPECSGTGPVDCALGTLGVGASAEVKLVVTSPAIVPVGGTITNSAVASPGANTAATAETTVEEPEDGVSKGWVSPNGSITIPGDDPATLSLPNDGGGAAVIMTQGEGLFCDGPCDGTTTTINDFDGYENPNFPITVVLTFTFSDTPDNLTAAADAYGATIYKNTDPENPDDGSPVPFCATLGAGKAIPSPCVDGRTITHIGPGEIYEVTFTIRYLSGDPKFGRR